MRKSLKNKSIACRENAENDKKRFEKEPKLGRRCGKMGFVRGRSFFFFVFFVCTFTQFILYIYSG